MNWFNPELSWPELERRLSGRPEATATAVGGDGGDSPAWTRRREPYQPPAELRRPSGTPEVPYAELHCHSAFSFLDGASQPEDLVTEAVRLGLAALALTDHDGMYGVVRFAEAASEVGLPTLFGVEVSLGLSEPRNGVPDPAGEHLLVLARDPDGYRRLSRAVSDAHLAGGEKGRTVVDVDAFTDAAGGHWQILTGCRKGSVPAALATSGQSAARRALQELVARFGRDNVTVELCDHGWPTDGERNSALATLAGQERLGVVATNNVHYATPSVARLAAAMAAVRARRSLDDMDGWLAPAPTAHLRSGAEMAARFARFPGAVAEAARIGAAFSFDLKLVTPRLPDFPVPPGHTEASWLRLLTEQGALRRYGPPGRERVAGSYAQLAHELDLIEALGFPGYFLIVHDIVEYCRGRQILCQGRGSAANSAVCYALGITNVDAVSFGLLFERFLAPERDGPPDIDLDIESGRREEVIQYVYERYGRQRAAQVANVITYRPRSAVRDIARALGFSPGQQDAWSRQLDRWAPPPAPGGAGPPGSSQPLRPPGNPSSGPPVGSPSRPSRSVSPSRTVSLAGPAGGRDSPEGDPPEKVPGHDIPDEVLSLANQLLGFPRHLGIHSGGMVICDRPVADVVPVEWARMPGRTVIQWDKDDCAAAGLVKFDLLGLGMLSMLHGAFDLVRAHHGRDLDLGSIPPEDPAVYDMLCAADSVGVFQVESRAQMATLPRLRPRRFYDLVIEVALIRPGPIQGGSVHPYIRRRNGTEQVTYPHPLLRRSLGKTLGVPLFQEQLMQMAIDVAGFSAAEADQLRRAMGSKRSTERIERLRQRFYEGTAANGILGPAADELFDKLAAFANYGFPESHSASFAFLVYASSWVKLYYPAAFCAALLNAQPMGFYSPQSLVADARRHGVVVRGPDVNASGAQAVLESVGSGPTPGRTVAGRTVAGRTTPGRDGSARSVAGRNTGDRHTGEQSGSVSGLGIIAVGAIRRADGEQPAVRLGLGSIRRVGADVAERVVALREAHGPYRDMADVARRAGLTTVQLESLATAGAFDCFGLSRREALWSAGAVAQAQVDRLEGMVIGADVAAVAPFLPGMTSAEEVVADLWATGITPGGYPTQFVRDRLDALGVLTAERLREAPADRKVLVAGVVTHRQRPATAGGTTFVSLEDETGLVNIVCSRGLWVRHRLLASSAPALIVRGRVEKAEGVVNVVAERLWRLPLAVARRSRDFR